MYQYQHTRRFFAQVSDGMENIAAEELAEHGGTKISPIHRGIHFHADNTALYRINYRSRLITRIFAPLISFNCADADVLYEKAKSITWSELFSVNETFAVISNVSNSNITHSKYAALRVKDAIVDQFRDRDGARPSVDRHHPDFSVNLHIRNNSATISAETTGGSLHRRGYRRETIEAPMQETLAAAIIRLSSWDGTRQLYDPMCGSGTLLCEALMQYCRLPSVVDGRRFGFECLPDFDSRAWSNVRSETAERHRVLPIGLIAGSDISLKAIIATKKNLSVFDDAVNVNIEKSDFNDLAGMENSVIVCNPPYGIRIGRDGSLPGFYKAFGDFLKQRCSGSEAYIYFGDREHIKHIGLRTTWKKSLKNGGLDGRLVKIELY